MAARLFIDGQSGTIGLRIHELLERRSDLSLLRLPDHCRKDPAARKEMLNTCDFAVLCLPDDAARESVSLVDNHHVRIIDGSTAFRVDPQWVYGLPELTPQHHSRVAAANRVSNPGCWATCVCLLTRPLVEFGLLPRDFSLCIHGVSGYSGGGKAAIRRWESPESGLEELPFEAPYSLDMVHKHIPEIRLHGLLATEPYFRPSVGSFARGLRVEVPLHAATLPADLTAERIRQVYRSTYEHQRFIRLGWTEADASIEELRFDPRSCNDTNDVLLHVVEHSSGHVLLVVVLDNLGKGASGAAVQALNLMLGIDEAYGLS